MRLPARQGEITLNNMKAKISRRDTARRKNILITQTVLENGELLYKDLVDVPVERLDEIISLYDMDVTRNINDKEAAIHGFMTLKIMAYKEKVNYPLLFISAWTLGFPCLFGMPANTITTTMEIQITVKNESGTPIKTYSGSGEGHTYFAMYWGYGKDAHPRSNVIAFKEAMTSVKQQMRSDSELLKIIP